MPPRKLYIDNPADVPVTMQFEHEITIDAYQWLVQETEQRLTVIGQAIKNPSDICGCFTWAYAPEGPNFWPNWPEKNKLWGYYVLHTLARLLVEQLKEEESFPLELLPPGIYDAEITEVSDDGKVAKVRVTDPLPKPKPEPVKLQHPDGGAGYIIVDTDTNEPEASYDPYEDYVDRKTKELKVIGYVVGIVVIVLVGVATYLTFTS